MTDEIWLEYHLDDNRRRIGGALRTVGEAARKAGQQIDHAFGNLQAMVEQIDWDKEFNRVIVQTEYSHGRPWQDHVPTHSKHLIKESP
ncbi:MULTISPECIES: hypothetical protein [unclassified Brevibacterium]|uniref:hypothetical protein n=1 Tax=unclassified Brevibacterium TaxID=2614124 RepID=UPI001E3D8D57|nr:MULTISPECIES: hypothetical protein [unclassified Brevibacterium]MCD1286501.1 hypothetical protein [Brevibacterium sp. CCUG 69071]MDK8434266.1 hypothetical protein [Brevibacterium sp. H-BE7]